MWASLFLTAINISVLAAAAYFFMHSWRLQQQQQSRPRPEVHEISAGGKRLPEQEVEGGKVLVATAALPLGSDDTAVVQPHGRRDEHTPSDKEVQVVPQRESPIARARFADDVPEPRTPAHPTPQGLRDMVHVAGGKPATSPFELNEPQWPAAQRREGFWDSVNRSDGVPSAIDSNMGSRNSEAELLALRKLPELMRARTMEAELGGFELGALLGKGSFGKVYKAKWRGTMVAVKVIEHDTTQSSKLMGLRESALSSSFQHPNVLVTYKVLTQPVGKSSAMPSYSSKDSAISRGGHRPSWMQSGLLGSPTAASAGSPPGEAPVHTPLTPRPSFPLTESSPLVSRSHQERCDTFEDAQETWMLMEYCDRGNLSRAISGGRFRLRADPSKHDTVAIYRTLIDVAAGMDFLHSVGVVHGDLKTCNVLLKSTSQYDDPRGFLAKIADFGLSQILDKEAAHVSTTSIGTVAYMPAELLQEGKMTPAVDVWSFGCIMWELWQGERMFQDVNVQQVFVRVLTGRRPAIPEGLPEGYRGLLEACWDAKAANRPPFGDITRWLRTLYYDLNNGERDCRRSLDINPWD